MDLQLLMMDCTIVYYFSNVGEISGGGFRKGVKEIPDPIELYL